MSAGSDNTSAAAADNYRKAIESYRSVAKWVVSSFGAVAAALVVGLPLTSLGELTGWRLVGAIACVTVAFLAILIVIRTASGVIEPLPPVDREDLRKEDFPFFDPLNEYLAEDPSMLGWDEVKTTAELTKEFDRLSKVEPDGKAAEEVTERLDLLVTFGSALYMKELHRKAMNRTYWAIAVAVAVGIGFAVLSTSAGATCSVQKAAASTPAPINVKVGGPRLLDWPRSCARLYFALDKLAADEPRVGPLWPAHSFSPWDRRCGLSSRADVARALAFLGHR